jgi:hypothetical protein
LAQAEEPTEEADRASGIEEPASYPDDPARDFGNVMLFVPRQVLEFLFWGTSIAVAVLENEQVVPRVQDIVSTPGGRLIVLPTILAETGGVFNVGARMIADFDEVATGVRVGFGGIHSFEIEPRMAYRLGFPLRSIITAEALYKRDNDLEFLGVGQVPEEDRRNRFLPGQRGAEAQYFEERSRWILGYGMRPSDATEFVMSASIDRRRIQDAKDGDLVLSDVFAPGDVPGDLETHTIIYGETAARLDTRTARGRPTDGFLAEAYVGTGRELAGEDVAFLRYGTRIAGFIPLYRTTNIFSPRLVLDGVLPLNDHELPFTELSRQPDFRGFDTRRDRISLVGSLDYRWLIVSSVAARVFFDTAVVAPELERIDLGALRWVGGFAFDLHSDASELGRLGFAAGPEGVRVLLTLGVSTGYGDRQHRK